MASGALIRAPHTPYGARSIPPTCGARTIPQRPKAILGEIAYRERWTPKSGGGPSGGLKSVSSDRIQGKKGVVNTVSGARIRAPPPWSALPPHVERGRYQEAKNAILGEIAQRVPWTPKSGGGPSGGPKTVSSDRIQGEKKGVVNMASGALIRAPHPPHGARPIPPRWSADDTSEAKRPFWVKSPTGSPGPQNRVGDP